MRMKVSVYKKVMQSLLLIGLLTLSGCGHNGDSLLDTAAREEISTESAETDSRTETENNTEAKESEMAGSAQSQLALLDVPVSLKKEDIFSRYSGVWAYDQEQGILENRASLSEIGLARGEESYPLTFLPDGRFVLLQIGKDGFHIKYIPAGK